MFKPFLSLSSFSQRVNNRDWVALAYLPPIYLSLPWFNNLLWQDIQRTLFDDLQRDEIFEFGRRCDQFLDRDADVSNLHRITLTTVGRVTTTPSDGAIRANSVRVRLKVCMCLYACLSVLEKRSTRLQPPCSTIWFVCARALARVSSCVVRII